MLEGGIDSDGYGHVGTHGVFVQSLEIKADTCIPTPQAHLRNNAEGTSVES